MTPEISPCGEQLVDVNLNEPLQFGVVSSTEYDLMPDRVEIIMVDHRNLDQPIHTDSSRLNKALMQIGEKRASLH